MPPGGFIRPSWIISRPRDDTGKQGQGALRKSHAVNLAVTKALKKAPTNNPLDSFTYIAGIRCKETGWLKGDTMLRDNKFTDDLSKAGWTSPSPITPT